MGIFKAQNSFTSGILSSALWGRVDLPQYQVGASIIKNFLVRPWGGITRRGGLYYDWAVKDPAVTTRLLPFRYSNGDAFVIEAGPEYFRFGKNGVLISGANGPAEIETPYTEEQLGELWITQSADVVWICHPDVATRKLLRYSDAEWYLQPVTFVDGPYLTVNTSTTTMVSDVETGTATVTAAIAAVITDAVGIAGNNRILVTTDIAHGLSTLQEVTISGVTGTVELNGTWRIATTGVSNQFVVSRTFINAYTGGGAIGAETFVATDVGRLLRLWYDDGTDAYWSWGAIASFISGSSVTVDVTEGKFPTGVAAPATTTWRLGKFSDTTGYPAMAALHQQRIAYAGSPVAPLDMDLSQTDTLDWFQTNRNLDIVATDAISYTLFSDQVNPINWMIPIKGGLGVGTAGGLWLFAGSGQNDALSATSLPVADEHVGIGAAPLNPAKTGNTTLFVDITRRRIHEFSYNWQEDGYQAPDMTLLTEHLTRSTKIKQIAWQSSERILWVLLEDGGLICVTYMREESVVAWQTVETLGTFQSIAVIPENDRDVVYAIVERQVNGSAVRYVEHFGDIFRGDGIADGYFLDSGVSAQLAYIQAPVISAAQTNPLRIEVDLSALSLSDIKTGNVVLIDQVVGMTELNGNHYAVVVVDEGVLDLFDELSVQRERVLFSKAAAWEAQNLNLVADDDALGAVAITLISTPVGGAYFYLGGGGTIGALEIGKTYRLSVRAYINQVSTATLRITSTVGGILDSTAILGLTEDFYEMEFVADAGDIYFSPAGLGIGDIAYILHDSLHLYEYTAIEGIDATGFTAYSSGGAVEPEARYITDLDHLEGETVKAVGDGMLIATKVVSAGVVDLGHYVKSYSVGLPFTSRVESLPLEQNDLKTGSTIGRIKSVNRIIARIHDSYYYRCGLIIDGTEQAIDEVSFMEDTIFGEAPSLVTAEKDLAPEGTYGTDVRYVIETDLPAPLNISAVVVELNQEDE